MRLLLVLALVVCVCAQGGAPLAAWLNSVKAPKSTITGFTPQEMTHPGVTLQTCKQYVCASGWPVTTPSEAHRLNVGFNLKPFYSVEVTSVNVTVECPISAGKVVTVWRLGSGAWTTSAATSVPKSTTVTAISLAGPITYLNNKTTTPPEWDAYSSSGASSSVGSSGYGTSGSSSSSGQKGSDFSFGVSFTQPKGSSNYCGILDLTIYGSVAAPCKVPQMSGYGSMVCVFQGGVIDAGLDGNFVVPSGTTCTYTCADDEVMTGTPWVSCSNGALSSAPTCTLQTSTEWPLLVAFDDSSTSGSTVKGLSTGGIDFFNVQQGYDTCGYVCASDWPSHDADAEHRMSVQLSAGSGYIAYVMVVNMTVQCAAAGSAVGMYRVAGGAWHYTAVLAIQAGVPLTMTFNGPMRVQNNGSSFSSESQDEFDVGVSFTQSAENNLCGIDWLQIYGTMTVPCTVPYIDGLGTVTCTGASMTSDSQGGNVVPDGSVCTYSCETDADEQMTGPPVTTCSNGVFDYDPPTCNIIVPPADDTGIFSPNFGRSIAVGIGFGVTVIVIMSCVMTAAILAKTRRTIRTALAQRQQQVRAKENRGRVHTMSNQAPRPPPVNPGYGSGENASLLANESQQVQNTCTLCEIPVTGRYCPECGKEVSPSAPGEDEVAPPAYEAPPGYQSSLASNNPIPQQAPLPGPGVWQGMKKDMHKMSLFLTVFLWIVFGVNVWCWLPSSICNPIAPSVALLCVGIGYLIECAAAHTRKYVSNVLTGQSAVAYVRVVAAQAPMIVMSISCYHWETRTRLVSYTDANGHTGHRTETYSERVVTYSEDEQFNYSSWQDISAPLAGADAFEVTKMEFSKVFAFGDERTRLAYEAQASSLQERNRYRDTHLSYSESLTVEGFTDHLLALVDETRRPLLLNARAYWICSLLTFTWPYRIWLASVSYKVHHQFVKEVTL